MPIPSKTTAVLLCFLCVVALHADWPPPPSTRMLPYRGLDIELRFPENWSVGQNAGFLYVTPTDAFVDGLLAYGMMIGTFDPQSETNLADATNQVVAQFREWNQNVSMVRYTGQTYIDGFEAIAVDMMNTSPAGGMETDLLVVVLRPNGLVTYFAGVVPERDIRDYRTAFDSILASVRFVS